MTGMPVTGHHAWGRAYGHDNTSILTQPLSILCPSELNKVDKGMPMETWSILSFGPK
jgi:hypothetical protein